MAYTIDHNAPASSTTGESIVTRRLDTSYYALTKNLQGEIEYSNMQSPLGLPELIKKRISNVANIYTGSGIDPTLMTPTKRGVSLNYNVRQTWTAADSTNPAAPTFAMPPRASLTITVPNNELITTNDVWYLIESLLGVIFPDGVDSLAKDLRGALTF